MQGIIFQSGIHYCASFKWKSCEEFRAEARRKAQTVFQDGDVMGVCLQALVKRLIAYIELGLCVV